MIDIDALIKGERYPNLKDSYILFICKNDPFKDDSEKGYGLPCYTFQNVCLEESKVNLNDKAKKVIYNASAWEKAEDQKIRDFLHFIKTNNPGKDDFSKRLSAMVEKLKDNDLFRRDYAAMNLHDFDIEQEATRKKAIEDATNCLKEGDSPEKVSRCIGLPLEEVLELQKNITVTA